jgi:hypothetical protein
MYEIKKNLTKKLHKTEKTVNLREPKKHNYYGN